MLAQFMAINGRTICSVWRFLLALDKQIIGIANPLKTSLLCFVPYTNGTRTVIQQPLFIFRHLLTRQRMLHVRCVRVEQFRLFQVRIVHLLLADADWHIQNDTCLVATQFFDDIGYT